LNTYWKCCALIAWIKKGMKTMSECEKHLHDVEFFDCGCKFISLQKYALLKARVKELELYICKNTDDNLTISDMTIFREIFARHNQNNF